MLLPESFYAFRKIVSQSYKYFSVYIKESWVTSTVFIYYFFSFFPLFLPDLYVFVC